MFAICLFLQSLLLIPIPQSYSSFPCQASESGTCSWGCILSRSLLVCFRSDLPRVVVGRANPPGVEGVCEPGADVRKTGNSSNKRHLLSVRQGAGGEGGAVSRVTASGARQEERAIWFQDLCVGAYASSSAGQGLPARVQPTRRPSGKRSRTLGVPNRLSGAASRTPALLVPSMISPLCDRTHSALRFANSNPPG